MLHKPLCSVLVFALVLAASAMPLTSLAEGPEATDSGLDSEEWGLLFPFPAGPGRILSGYDAGSHTGGDEYAVDFCQGDNCIQSRVGDPVLAPADMRIVASLPGYGRAGYDDYHIFELLSQSPDTLCVSLGHLHLDPSTSASDLIAQGIIVGTVGQYDMSVPHIHMGLWRVPAGCSCAGYERTPLAFSGPFALDGDDWPSGARLSGAIASTNAVCDDCAARPAQLQPPLLDDAEFVADVSIPDHTTMAAGALFRKTWRFQNTGTTIWTTEYALAHIDGERYSGLRLISIPWPVPPGLTVEVSAYLTAPEGEGTWRGDWRLLNADGDLFGDSVWVKICTDASPASPTHIW